MGMFSSLVCVPSVHKCSSTNSGSLLLCEKNCLSAGGKGACFIKSSSLFQLNYKKDALVCIHACSCASMCVCVTKMITQSRQHLTGDTITFPFVMETSLGINVKLLRREQSNKWAKDGGRKKEWKGNRGRGRTTGTIKPPSDWVCDTSNNDRMWCVGNHYDNKKGKVRQFIYMAQYNIFKVPYK